MTSFTSESNSNPFAGEEMQRHLSYYFFSLTTDVNRVSQNPLVPAAQSVNLNTGVPGVRVHFFCDRPSVNSISPPVNGDSK